MSFSLIYICCSLILFPFLLLSFYIVPYPSFSSMSFSLIYICCSFRGGILSAVYPTVAICFRPTGNLECPCLFSDLILFPFLLLFFYIVPDPSFSSMSFSLIYICCSFRGGILSVHCSLMFLTRREPGVPLSLFRSYPLPFSPPFLLYCSFSSMSFSLIYICCSLILFPFLLLFFYIVPYPSFSSMSFSLIYICCSFRGGILSVVFPL